MRIYGDIHGDFNTFKFCIKNLKDMLIVVAGDCGIGFSNSMNYYDSVFIPINTIAQANNLEILLLRGNHDDPKYFSEGIINYSNVKTIPDYYVIDKHILCVGGGLSIDRILRKERDTSRNKYTSNKRYSYWEDELPIYDEDKLNKITDSIDTIISHTAPSFFPLTDDIGIQDWIKYDPELAIDLKKERGEMDKLYNYYKHHLKNWIYGHFHHKMDGVYENVHYYMLDCIQNDLKNYIEI